MFEQLNPSHTQSMRFGTSQAAAPSPGSQPRASTTVTTELLRVGNHRRPVTAPEDVGDRIAALHDALAATAERPVDPTANRWLGEAEAVAGDLVDADVDPAVRRKRVGHVQELLSHVRDTGDDEADDCVERARRLAGDILASNEDG